MKKIFTLLTGLFLAVAVMAADRGPDLTIRSSKNFKIVIDGKTFFNNNSYLRVNDLRRGMHNIQVFEMRSGNGYGYGNHGRRERLVSSTSFFMGKRDVRIFIDYSGRINVIQDKDVDRNDKGWNDRNNDRDDRDRDYRDNRDDDRRNDGRRNF